MLKTEDLILKKAQYEDWKDLYRNLWSHAESARYMLWSVTITEDQAQKRMLATMEYQKEHLAYTVYEKKSGQAIGFAGMEEISDRVYEDTGIAIGPAYTGKGYGKQILMALVQNSFQELEAVKFIGSCRAMNLPSKKMFLSCGFQYTHSEDRVDKRNGEKYILEFFELLNEKANM